MSLIGVSRSSSLTDRLLTNLYVSFIRKHNLAFPYNTKFICGLANKIGRGLMKITPGNERLCLPFEIK